MMPVETRLVWVAIMLACVLFWALVGRGCNVF